MDQLGFSTFVLGNSTNGIYSISLGETPPLQPWLQHYLSLLRRLHYVLSVQIKEQPFTSIGPSSSIFLDFREHRKTYPVASREVTIFFQSFIDIYHRKPTII